MTTTEVRQTAEPAPTPPRERREVLPRWCLGGGYLLLWLLGAGFLWLPLALLRVVAVRRWRLPNGLLVVGGVILPLGVSLVAAAALNGAPPSRVVAGLFLLVPWVLLGVASFTTWTSRDQRALTRGLVDLALIQGALVGVAQLLHPRWSEVVLPLGHLLPDSVAQTPPLDAWTVSHLAFSDFYGGVVVRSGGMFGNPTWAGAIAAGAALCLLCRPRDHVRRSPLTWPYAVAALAACLVTLRYTYSRNDVLGLVLGLLVAGVLAGMLRLRRRDRLLLGTLAVVLAAVASVVLDVGFFFRQFNAPRAGSLDARQEIYVQTLQAIHRHPLLLGSGIKEQGENLVASLGTHSTYLGLIYRGGWLAFWAFCLYLITLLVLACLRRSPLAAGLTTFTILWCTAEDLDAGHLVPVLLVLATALVQRAGPPPCLAASDQLADELVDRYASRRPTSITWLNHFTAQRCDQAGIAVRDLTLIGVDGNGLRWLLSGAPPRTSADLVLPLVLPRLTGARIALLGGTPDALQARVDKVTATLPPGASVVGAIDGFAGLLRGDALRAWVAERRADVVLVALGAPLQEQVALELRGLPGVVLVSTCGGLLDQLVRGGYYPRWAYPLGLNWVVRLVREPRRLWKRYSVYVVLAVVRQGRLRRWVSAQPGYGRCASVCAVAEDPYPA